MDVWKKASRVEVGHGGWDCPCCRDRNKKGVRRRTRARMKRDLLAEIKSQEAG
jgi:hypothetical protein